MRDVLDDPERSDEIADERLENYAKGRKIQIADDPRGGNMAAKIRALDPNRVSNPFPQTRQGNPQMGRSELLSRIRELQEENDRLQDTLDKVGDLAAAPADGKDEDPDELVDKLNDIIDTVAALDEEDQDKDDADEEEPGEE
jgi:hypothetical protein